MTAPVAAIRARIPGQGRWGRTAEQPTANSQLPGRPMQFCTQGCSSLKKNRPSHTSPAASVCFIVRQSCQVETIGDLREICHNRQFFQKAASKAGTGIWRPIPQREGDGPIGCRCQLPQVGEALGRRSPGPEKPWVGEALGRRSPGSEKTVPPPLSSLDRAFPRPRPLPLTCKRPQMAGNRPFRAGNPTCRYLAGRLGLKT